MDISSGRAVGFATPRPGRVNRSRHWGSTQPPPTSGNGVPAGVTAPIPASLPAHLAAYTGPPPMTVTSAFTAWTAHLPTILVTLLLAGGYLWGVRRYRERTGQDWVRGRTTAYLIGCAFLLYFGVSLFGVYADTLFWARAGIVITLLMVAPLFLAMGSPVALALGALSEPGQLRLRAVLASKPARILTYPASASVLLVGTPWLLYFTGWYPAVLDSAVTDDLTRLALLLVGFLYFYSRLQLDPVPRKYPHLISIVITFVEVIFDAALGLVLWLNPHIVAFDHYAAVARDWGPTLRNDQIIGAGVLWLVGDLAGLPFLSALTSRMAKDDAEEAAEIDRELDEQDEARSAAAASGESAEAPARLWWEDDPQLAERFRRTQSGG
jgi:cytochrome c oxidase assembly factor CtaG